MLVRHPTRIQAWAWPDQGGTSSTSPRSWRISQKSTFKVESCQERYLLCVSAPHLDKMGATLSGALLHNLHHASPSELVWVGLAYNRVGNSCFYISKLPAIVCVRQDFYSVSLEASTSAQFLILWPTCIVGFLLPPLASLLDTFAVSPWLNGRVLEIELDTKLLREPKRFFNHDPRSHILLLFSLLPFPLLLLLLYNFYYYYNCIFIIIIFIVIFSIFFFFLSRYPAISLQSLLHPLKTTGQLLNTLGRHSL